MLLTRFPENEDARLASRVLRVAVTFYLVVMGFVFFRASSLPVALRVLMSMHWSNVASQLTYDSVRALALTLLALVSCHGLDYLVVRRAALLSHRLALWPVIALLLAFSIGFGLPTNSFIYVQF